MIQAEADRMWAREWPLFMRAMWANGCWPSVVADARAEGLTPEQHVVREIADHIRRLQAAREMEAAWGKAAPRFRLRLAAT